MRVTVVKHISLSGLIFMRSARALQPRQTLISVFSARCHLVSTSICPPPLAVTKCRKATAFNAAPLEK